MKLNPDQSSALPLGVWKRGNSDWAYRIEVEGYGSIFGCGFSRRDVARDVMQRARRDAERRVAERAASDEERRDA